MMIFLSFQVLSMILHNEYYENCFTTKP